MKPTIALIINTCDQPDYLARVLRAIAGQSDSPEEVIVAEDGLDEPTRKVVQDWAEGRPPPVRHVTQAKHGFHRTRILNAAIAQAAGDYVVFLDGDTIPHPSFIADHRALARRGFFVQGHRALVRRRASVAFGRGTLAGDRLKAILTGQLAGLKHAFRWWTPLRRVKSDTDGVRGCNLGVWRADLVAVNGYDEAYVGWGCEDHDLALRLINSGARRLDVRGWALCYHLWHAPADRSNLASNQKRLAEAASDRRIRCDAGLDRQRVSCRP